MAYKGRAFIYKINKDFLLKELKISEPVKETEGGERKVPKNRENTGNIETPEIVREMVEILTKQLLTKDKQIESLGDKINNLIERDRETNIILKSLQDKMFLLEAGQRNQDSEKDRNKPTEANISEKKPEKKEGEEKPSQKEDKGIYEL